MDAELTLLVFEICVTILVTGFGIKFVFYDDDGPNLDWVYRKYFNGRVRKNYAEFTRTAGFLMLTLAILYLAALVWNRFSPISLLLFGG